MIPGYAPGQCLPKAVPIGITAFLCVVVLGGYGGYLNFQVIFFSSCVIKVKTRRESAQSGYKSIGLKSKKLKTKMEIISELKIENY